MDMTNSMDTSRTRYAQQTLLRCAYCPNPLVLASRSTTRTRDLVGIISGLLLEYQWARDYCWRGSTQLQLLVRACWLVCRQIHSLLTLADTSCCILGVCILLIVILYESYSQQYAEYAYYESYSNQYAYSTSSYSSRNNGQSWIRTIHFNSVVCVYMTDFVRSRRQHLSEFVRSQRQIFWPLCASPLVFFRVRHQYQMLLYAYGYDVT